MVYVDTSALVPIFIREARSEALVAWLESAEERLAISEWSLLEFASAAAIKVRTRETTQVIAKEAQRRVREFAQEHCLVAVPGRDDFRRAAEWAADATLKVRAGDALHLSIAKTLGVEALLCLDDSMTESAKALDMKVVSV